MLARDGNEQTFLHVAAKMDNSKEYEKLWDWATEKLTAEELRKTLLAKDQPDHTVFNVTANGTNNDAFWKMWKYTTEKVTVEEIRILFTFRQQRTKRVDLGEKRVKVIVFQKLTESATRK